MMRRIYLVYDDCYEDADELFVPEVVCQSAELLPGRYSRCLSSIGSIHMETEGFVQWLNQVVCPGGEQAIILHQHISANPEEFTIHF